MWTKSIRIWSGNRCQFWTWLYIQTYTHLYIHTYQGRSQSKIKWVATTLCCGHKKESISFRILLTPNTSLWITQCSRNPVTFHAYRKLSDTLFLDPCITDAPSVVTHKHFCVGNLRSFSMYTFIASNIVAALGVPTTRTIHRNFVHIFKEEKCIYLTIRIHWLCVDLSRESSSKRSKMCFFRG